MNNRLEEIRNNWDSMAERWNDFRNDIIINKTYRRHVWYDMLVQKYKGEIDYEN